MAVCTGDYKFLSNFFVHPIQMGGYTFQTVEHFYQAMKTVDPHMWHLIARADTPGQAKRLGRSAILRPEWDMMKDYVMWCALWQKFSDPLLFMKLQQTGDAVLVEGNAWGDRYWGVCDGVGQNKLGQQLMSLRVLMGA